MDLDGTTGAAIGGLAGEELGRRGSFAEGLVRFLQGDGTFEQAPRGLRVDVDVGQELLDQLMPGDEFAELPPCAGLGQAQLKGHVTDRAAGGSG